MRSKLLLHKLAEAAVAEGTAEGLPQFKQLSAGYQRDEIDAHTYASGFVALFGAEISRRLFPELANLLPDPAKRDELSAAYQSFALAQPLAPGLGGAMPALGRGRGRGQRPS